MNVEISIAIPLILCHNIGIFKKERMNFVDRSALGNTLAHRLRQFRGKDAVILCLQESSLMTCLTMARQLRAWVYPLIYVPVYTPDVGHKLLGSFDQDGDFCPCSADADSEDTPETAKIIKAQRSSAMKQVKKQMASFGMNLDKQAMNGRDVILAADVITSTLPLIVTQHFLKNVAPKSLTAVVGNVTPEVARQVRISADKTDILDILSGIILDDHHYFEHEDTYTEEQKHTILQHIATYWQ